MYQGSTLIMKVAVLVICLHQDDIVATHDFADLVTGFKTFTTSKKLLNCHDVIEALMSKDFKEVSKEHIDQLRIDSKQQVLDELEERSRMHSGKY